MSKTNIVTKKYVQFCCLTGCVSSSVHKLEDGSPPFKNDAFLVRLLYDMFQDTGLDQALTASYPRNKPTIFTLQPTISVSNFYDKNKSARIFGENSDNLLSNTKTSGQKPRPIFPITGINPEIVTSNRHNERFGSDSSSVSHPSSATNLGINQTPNAPNILLKTIEDQIRDLKLAPTSNFDSFLEKDKDNQINNPSFIEVPSQYFSTPINDNPQRSTLPQIFHSKFPVSDSQFFTEPPPLLQGHYRSTNSIERNNPSDGFNPVFGGGGAVPFDPRFPGPDVPERYQPEVGGSCISSTGERGKCINKGTVS